MDDDGRKVRVYVAEDFPLDSLDDSAEVRTLLRHGRDVKVLNEHLRRTPVPVDAVGGGPRTTGEAAAFDAIEATTYNSAIRASLGWGDEPDHLVLFAPGPSERDREELRELSRMLLNEHGVSLVISIDPDPGEPSPPGFIPLPPEW